MFKVNNRNATKCKICSSVSIVKFEQVNADWEMSASMCKVFWIKPIFDLNKIAEEVFFDFVFICSLAQDLLSLVPGSLILLVSKKRRNFKSK